MKDPNAGCSQISRTAPYSPPIFLGRASSEGQPRASKPGVAGSSPAGRALFFRGALPSGSLHARSRGPLRAAPLACPSMLLTLSHNLAPFRGRDGEAPTHASGSALARESTSDASQVVEIQTQKLITPSEPGPATRRIPHRGRTCDLPRSRRRQRTIMRGFRH